MLQGSDLPLWLLLGTRRQREGHVVAAASYRVRFGASSGMPHRRAGPRGHMDWGHFQVAVGRQVLSDVESMVSASMVGVRPRSLAGRLSWRSSATHGPPVWWKRARSLGVRQMSEIWTS